MTGIPMFPDRRHHLGLPLLGVLLCECTLLTAVPDDSSAQGGVGPGGSGGTSATANGGTGGAGATGAGGAALSCPSEFAVSLGNDASGVTITHAALTPTGHVVVGGPFNESFAFAPGLNAEPTSSDDYFVGAFDPVGQGSWLFQLGAPNANGLGLDDIEATSDGGVVVAVRASGGTSGAVLDLVEPLEIPPNAQNGFIIKLGSSGAIEWVKHLEGPGMNWLRSVAEAPNGDIIAAGSAGLGASIEGMDLGLTSTTQAPFVLRASSAGTVTYAHAYPTGSGYVTDVAVADQATFLFGSFYGIFPDPGVVNVPPSADESDLFLISLDESGDAIGGYAFGSDGREDYSSGLVDLGDGLLLYGILFSPGASPKGVVWGGLDEQSVPDDIPVSYIGKVGYDGSGEWFTSFRFQALNFSGSRQVAITRPHSGLLTLGHFHADFGQPIGAEAFGEFHTTPDTDSMWLSLDENGQELGLRRFGSAVNAEVYLNLRGTPCGDIVFGRYEGVMTYESTTYDGSSGRGFLAFHPEGVTFDPPP